MNKVPLDAITLRKGAHESRDDGVCLMEAVAWYAGEKHTDRPTCVCPMLNRMGIRLNDSLPDEKRIRLLQYVPRLVGTAGDGHQQARGLMAMDWIIRTNTPTWMEAAKMDASALRALPEIRSWDDVVAAQPLLDDARTRGVAAARAAAWAAQAAAWASAWAAQATTWAAAQAAAKAATQAHELVLIPIHDQLQDDALRLFGEMVALGREDRALYTLPVEQVLLEQSHA